MGIENVIREIPLPLWPEYFKREHWEECAEVQLRKCLRRYVPDLGGILMSLDKITIRKGQSCLLRPELCGSAYLRVTVHCSLLKPQDNDEVDAIVKNVKEQIIICLAYDAFTLVVPRNLEEEERNSSVYNVKDLLPSTRVRIRITGTRAVAGMSGSATVQFIGRILSVCGHESSKLQAIMKNNRTAYQVDSDTQRETHRRKSDGEREEKKKKRMRTESSLDDVSQ